MEVIMIIFMLAGSNSGGVDIHHIGGFKDIASCQLAIEKLPEYMWKNSHFSGGKIKAICVKR